MARTSEKWSGDKKRTSVAVVTGAVGVGKTSCLVELVDALPRDAVPAVIVHDFALGFGVSPPPTFRRSCFYEEAYDAGSGRECRELRDLLRAIAARSDGEAPGGDRVTHLLIETSGVGDAGHLAGIFHEPEFLSSFRLDGIVAVAEPERVCRLLLGTPGSGGGEGDAGEGSSRSSHGVFDQAAKRQLAVASVVCLNPTESADDSGDAPSSFGDRPRRATGTGTGGAASSAGDAAVASEGPAAAGAGAAAAVADAPDDDPHIAMSGIQAASGVAAAGAGAAETVVTHLAAATVSIAAIGVQAVGSVTANAWETLSSIVELNAHRTWEGVCSLTSSALSHSASVVDVGIEGAAAVAHEAVTLASVTAETATILTAASLDAAASLPAASMGVVAASASVAGAAGSMLAGAVINTAGFAAGYVGLIGGSPLETALRAAAPGAVFVTTPLVRAGGRKPGEAAASPGATLWSLLEGEGSFAAAAARREAAAAEAAAADPNAAAIVAYAPARQPASSGAESPRDVMSPGFYAAVDEEEDDGRITWRCRELAATGVSAAKVEAWLAPLVASGAILRVRGSLALRGAPPPEDPPLLPPLSGDPWASPGARRAPVWCDEGGDVAPHTFVIDRGGSFSRGGRAAGRPPHPAPSRAATAPMGAWLAAEGRRRATSETGTGDAAGEGGGEEQPHGGVRRRQSSSDCDLPEAAARGGERGEEAPPLQRQPARPELPPAVRRLVPFRAPRRSLQFLPDALLGAPADEPAAAPMGHGGASTGDIPDHPEQASGANGHAAEKAHGANAGGGGGGSGAAASVRSPPRPGGGGPPRPPGHARPPLPAASASRKADAEAAALPCGATQLAPGEASSVPDAKIAPAQLSFRVEFDAAFGRPFSLRVVPAPAKAGAAAPAPGLLVVGRRLDSAALRAELSACYAPEGFLPACASAALPSADTAGVGTEVELDNGTRVALWRVSGKIVATAAECPHASAPLAHGTVVDMEDMDQLLLTCSRHKFSWDASDGRPVSALGCGPVAVYSAEEVLGNVYVAKAPRAAPPPPRRRSTTRSAARF